MPLRLKAPLLALALTSALAAANASTSTPPKPRLESQVFAWDRLVAKPTPNGERRDVANHPTRTLDVFECHITTLNPGRASHAPHRHPQEEFIIVKEGTVEVHINGQTQVAGPGSTFFYAANDAHAVKNVGETRATYWVINLATAATHDRAAWNATPTLRSAVYDHDKLPVKQSKTGQGRAILNGSTVTLKNLETHITSVNAGLASHGAHRHPDDEVVLVREGTLEINLNGQLHRAPTGSVCFFSSNDLHGMRNIGDTRATYHVIRIVTAATPPAEKKP